MFVAARVKIGAILKNLRQKKGVVLSRAAADAGMTAPALSYYEKDEKDPSLEYAIKLADYYGVTLDELCGRETVAKQKQTDAKELYIALRGSITSQEIKFDWVKWQESKEPINPDKFDPSDIEEATPGLTIRKPRATWTIYDSNLVGFMEGYERLLAVVSRGDLDESVLDIWLEKQLSEGLPQKGDKKNGHGDTK